MYNTFILVEKLEKRLGKEREEIEGIGKGLGKNCEVVGKGLKMNLGDYPVLFVDDEATNRLVIEHTLSKHFTVIFAESGENALEILSNQPVSVLLTDNCMPGMSGIDLAENVFFNFPDIVRIIITAYSDLPTAIDAINRGRVSYFIKKPWSPEELMIVVKQAIEFCHREEVLKSIREEQFYFDRLRSLGILSSGIAHDIRQPLNYVGHFIHAIKNNLQKIRDLEPEDKIADILCEVDNDLTNVSRGFDVLSTLSSNLLNHVSCMPIEKEAFSLRELVDGVLSISKFTIKKYSDFALEVSPRDVQIVCCKSRLSQLILNLLLNAAQSITVGSPSDNMITLKIFLDDSFLFIEVTDTGCGMKKEIRRKIFDPLFSTKERNSIGLGLSICKQNVEDLDGNIEVDTKEGEGTTFRVRIPISVDTNSA